VGGHRRSILHRHLHPSDPTTAAMVTLHNSSQVPQKPGSNETTAAEVWVQPSVTFRGHTAERMFVGLKSWLSSTLSRFPPSRTTIPICAASSTSGGGVFSPAPCFLWLKWTYNHIVPNWDGPLFFRLSSSHRLAPLAHHADEVDAQNAAHRAADQVHPGEIQKVHAPRSAQAAMNEEISGSIRRKV